MPGHCRWGPARPQDSSCCHSLATTTLVGDNTTMLRILYAALRPATGTVSLDDTPVAALSISDISRRIGVVAQESPSEIPLTVAEMVLLGRSPHRSAFESYHSEDHRIAAAARSSALGAPRTS
jgi:ABC-type cobalamin/Fe3+-siderophores transport system ATPase subunit